MRIWGSLMIENWVVTSVHRVCTMRALAIVMCCLPVSAFANAWSTFQTHCLAPLEATADPITDAFEWIHEDSEIDVHLLEIGDLSITVNVYKEGTFSPIGCEMHLEAEAAWAEVEAGFQLWRATVLADQTYVLDEAGRGLLSTTQREPLIRVSIVTPDEAAIPYVVVEETRLES